jgi:MHS family alpha-ketoglutarate permease-like MFS transporter
MINNLEGAPTLATNRPRSAHYKMILGGSIGHFIEWYEFSIYGFMGGILAAQMFPSSDPTVSLIASFTAFAIGFLGRPIGAIVLSPLCDKFGRRKLLSATILMAGTGSLLIGICPPYAKIGIFAPLIIAFSRIIQGFSAGGEFQIAIAFINEHVKGKNRAFSASPQNICIGLGILSASAVGGLTTHFVPAGDLEAWGWRIPFLFGAALSLYGVFARRELGETPEFQKIGDRRDVGILSILGSLAKYPKQMLIVFIIEMNVVLYLVFLPTYAHMVGGFDRTLGLTASVMASLLFCVAVPVFAYLSDRVGRKPLFIAAAILSILFTYPLLSILKGNPSFMEFLSVAIAGSMFVALTNSVFATTLAEIFPTEIRATGIGIPYAISVAAFGGTTPLIVTWLQKINGVFAVSSYIIVISLISLICYVCLLPETRERSLGK